MKARERLRTRVWPVFISADLVFVFRCVLSLQGDRVNFSREAHDIFSIEIVYPATEDFVCSPWTSLPLSLSLTFVI